MTPQQFAKLESIYHEAAIAPPDVQQRLIRETALEDPLVGQKLAEMLAVSPHGGARDVTEHLHASDLSESTSEPSVVRVGTYSVIRTIGQGGMGTVYEAQQAEPRRRVALKLLSIGGRSAAVLRRFRRESSILARLQHPGIAQIFDAGFGEVEFAANRSGMQPAISTAPFFTMELVDGQNICAAATALRLDTAARLQLLAAVCDSVQHAHQQGIIHRDLKPANILLASTETLQPKVLDFGIARMIGDNALTGVTEFGQIIGTLAYMSPEQVAGDSSRVDTRSDVYALGACLYELLAGQPAFDTVNRPITDVIRMIRESNVPRLGNKHPQFRGDVETIVAKAMDRERERRYGSAAELAADIRRYLRDEPILARPNSTLYQLRKFARRNRTLVGSAGIVLVTLVAGLIISTGLYFRAQEETVRAEKATEFARAREREAQQQAYLATLAAAAAALQDNDVVGARTHLERAPLDLRGWEWRHFWSRLDDSTSCFRADDELMDWSALHWQSNPPAIQVSLAGENRGLQNIELSSPYQSTVVRDARRGPGQFSPDGKHSVAVLADRSLTGDSLDKPWLPDIPPSAIVCYPSISSDGTIAFGIYRNAGLEQIEIRRTNGSTARITSPPARFAQVLRHDIVAIYGGDSARFWLWFADSGEVREHRVASPVRALSVGEDESRFVLGLEDGTFEMRAVADGAHISGGGRHEGAVSAVAINPDGTIIASAGIDRTVRLWNVVSSGDSRILLGHTEPVRSLTFSADGTQLASAGDDRQIRIWQISQLRDPSVLRGHSNYVYPVAFSPGGDWLASASWDGTVRIWPIKSGEPIVLESNMQSPLGLLWHPHRKCVVVYGLNKNNRYSCEAIGFDGYNVHGTWGDESVEVRPAGFLKDSDTLIVEWRNEQSEVRGWSIGDGRSWIERMQPRWLDGLFIPDRVDELSVLFDSSGDSMPLFQVVNCLTQIPLWSFVATTSRTFAIEQTCGDRHRIAIISTTNPREILIRDLRTGRIVTTLRGHTDEVLALAWSPDGSRVASAGRDRLIRIWDAQNWWQLAQLAGHTSYVWSLAFSPDGALLASGSGDKTVRLWRIAGP